MTMAFEKWMTWVKSYYSEELLHVKFMMKRVAKSKWNVNANSFSESSVVLLGRKISLINEDKMATLAHCCMWM